MRFLKTHFGEGRAASPPSADLQQLGLTDGPDKDPRLEVALWGAGLGLWETDFRTDLTHWYDDWCQHIDLDPCEGHDHAARWDEYVHPEDRALFRDAKAQQRVAAAWYSAETLEVDLAVFLQVLRGEVLECRRAGHRGLPSPPTNFTRGRGAVK